MSVYKILIGKDMPPQNKNTSHIFKNFKDIILLSLRKDLAKFSKYTYSTGGIFCAHSPQAIDFCD